MTRVSVDKAGGTRMRHQQSDAARSNRGESTTLRTLTIVIDHLPDVDLSPNSRCHWSTKSCAVKAAQDEIGWLSKVDWHDDKPMMKARISYEFHLKDHRKRDLDNLLASMKSYQDGLIEAGILFFDDAEHLEIGQVKASVTGHEGMIVSLEEL